MINKFVNQIAEGFTFGVGFWVAVLILKALFKVSLP